MAEKGGVSEMNGFVLPEKILCGYYDAKGQKEVTVSKMRTTTMFEVELFLEAARTVHVDGKVYTIKKNHILICRPGQERYSVLPYYTFYVKFPAEGLLAQLLESMPAYFQVFHNEKMCALFREMINLYEEEKAVYQLKLYAKLLALLDLIQKDIRIGKETAGMDYYLMHDARKYIEEHLFEPIKVSDIARAVSLSTSYFHGVFCKTMGISPYKYVTQKRVEAAKEMLWGTSKSISDIAENCGFGCQQQFTAIFKRVVGMSPGKYRKSFMQRYYD